MSMVAVVVWSSTIVGEHLPATARVNPHVMVGALLVCLVSLVRRTVCERCAVTALMLLALTNGARVWSSLPEVSADRCDGVAALVTDPAPIPRGTAVIVSIDGRRFKASAFGSAGWRVARRLAGEKIWISGRCEPLSGGFARRDRINHVVGKVSVVDASEQFDEGSALVRSVNRLRRAMAEGVSKMPEGLRALFTGLVIGDDRYQSRSMVDDFRASGLSHLCAVSGQNVAYLLALMSPMMKRLRRSSRWWATMAVLVWFVVLTRGEPSVLRAAFMAAVVATVNVVGVRVNARSVLAIVVIVLLMVDPMLAWSVGFALSVGATAGLAWLSGGLGRVLGGRGMLASTLAAQIGTMPVSLWVFGHVPVVSLVANPLTIGTAGVVMTVGLPCALIAGIHPAAVRVVSAAFSVPVGWIAGVAHVAAIASPAGTTNAVAWFMVAVWIGVGHRRQRRRTTDVAG